MKVQKGQGKPEVRQVKVLTSQDGHDAGQVEILVSQSWLTQGK